MAVVEDAPVVARRTARVHRRVRWASAVVAAIGLLLVAEITLRALEDRLPPPSGWITDEYPMKRERMEELAGRGGVGVALVGSSVMDVAVDPALLSDAATGGRGAYNAALVAATPSITDVWTTELVVPALRPDVVVVALSSRDLNGNGVGMALQDDLFAKSLGGAWLLDDHSVADRVEWWLQERSALLRHRQALRRPLEAFTGYDPPDRNATVLTDLGLETHLLDVAYRGDETTRDFFRQQPLRDFAVTDTEVAAIRRLATRLEADGVEVVLLDVPVTEDYVSLHPHGDEDLAAYQAVVDAVARETGADVLRIGTWPVELFSDPLHLNGAGVRRLSAELDAYLATGR